MPRDSVSTGLFIVKTLKFYIVCLQIVFGALEQINNAALAEKLRRCYSAETQGTILLCFLYDLLAYSKLTYHLWIWSENWIKLHIVG